MSELSDLYSERDAKYAEKDACENEIASLSSKIERLKTVKSQLDDYRCYEYSEASCVSTNLAMMETYPWSGEKFMWVFNYTRETLCSDFIAYDNSLSRIRDDLCDEITRLENEKYSHEGWLGSIKSALNSIGNAIEKFFM